MSDRSEQEFPPFEHADAGVETDASPEELALHMEEESGEFALDEAYEEGLVDEEELGEELLGAVERIEDDGDDEGDDEDEDGEDEDRSVEELDDYVDHQLLELVDEDEADDEADGDRAERGERVAANHDDEVVCPSCHLAHHRSAITVAGICRDCAS